MKVLFNDFRVTPDNQNKILRCSYESEEEINGITVPIIYVEPLESKIIPYDDNLYLVPAILRYKDEREVKGYVSFLSLYQMEDAGYRITNEQRLKFDFDYVDAEYLYPSEGYSEEIFENSKSLPQTIEWENFNEENCYPNVAYAFQPVKTELADMDQEYIKVVKELSGDLDEESDLEPAGVYYPKFLLHKVFINKIPEIGFLFYVPAEITINSKQKRNGYALYDVERKSVIDLHIIDKKLGHVSTEDRSALEDLGLFVDEKAFSYKLLLTDIINES